MLNASLPISKFKFFDFLSTKFLVKCRGIFDDPAVKLMTHPDGLFRKVLS